MSDEDISLLFVSETWITDIKNNITRSIRDLGYKIIHQPRNQVFKARGGGVAIIHHTKLNLTQVFIKHGGSFESVVAKFRDDIGEIICCAVVYRTGPVSDDFFSDF